MNRKLLLAFPLMIIATSIAGFSFGAWSERSRWAQYELLCREALADEIETPLMIRNCVAYTARAMGEFQ